ncbi:universal stress protein [Aeoliella sp. SH292]|uniref:universal stress protein n=1 Tax=Aeoliella sp. SH292 TaxID=3454464 RepID=UPI003F950F66
MLNISTILVGVDLSHGDWRASEDCETPSHFACEQAIALAAAIGQHSGSTARVHFLATLDLDERSKRLIRQTPEGETTALDLAKQAIRRQVKLATEAGVTADSEVLMGQPRLELIKRTQEGAADLVIVGNRGHGLFAGMVMGSTAIALIHHAACPVWVVKPHDSDTPRRILVATDFSPVCDRLLAYGIELARLFAAELHVVHVIANSPRSFMQFVAVDDVELEREHVDAMRDARKKMDAIAARADVRELQSPAVVHLEEGVPNRVILEKTKEIGIDLLLMGAVAWSGMTGILLGSTAQKLLPSLDCSLLTLRDAPST